jgi:hypothetical protein
MKLDKLLKKLDEALPSGSPNDESKIKRQAKEAVDKLLDEDVLSDYFEGEDDNDEPFGSEVQELAYEYLKKLETYLKTL